MKYTVKTMLQGAAWFWIPDIVLHALVRKNFSGMHVRMLTILLPILCIGWWLLYCRGKHAAPPIRSALTAVLGIWVFGPLAMMMSSVLSGGGLPQSVGAELRFVGMGTILFPFYTFVMSTYDGALGALLIVTAGLPVIALSSRRWRKARDISLGRRNA